jgi:cell division protein FtsN
MSRKWVVAVMLLVPVVSRAQSSPDSAVYRRAQTLVNDGNAMAGRAIVDSMIIRAAPGTNEYAEGLYWRAVLSATASDAEMDYRRIIVDFPLSPRVEDVLLRLAQLELARADYDGALQHLNRLTLEHPAGAARARAGYWTARVLFEKNDIQRACAINADALARTSENDTELRNQISYLNQRCIGVAIAAVPASGEVSDSTGSAKAADSLSLAAAPTIAPTVVPTPVPVASMPGQVAVTTADTVAVNPNIASKKPPLQILSAPRDAKPSIVNTMAKAGAPARKTEAPKNSLEDTSVETGGYSVQIAAYNVKSQAQAMMAKLKGNGYQARVSGVSAPFRVRIGHYATQAQATAVMRSLKAKKIDGFVVKAE